MSIFFFFFYFFPFPRPSAILILDLQPPSSSKGVRYPSDGQGELGSGRGVFDWNQGGGHSVSGLAGSWRGLTSSNSGAMMSTMAMPAGSIGSRYRKLRGKSVSETHKAVEHALGEQMDDSSLVPSQSTLGSSGGWRECSNAQGNVNTVHVSGIDPHYPVPPVPLPPSSQKDHAITTRPRAAVMPPGPLFGQPISPTPLRIRQSSQALTPQPQSAPDTTASTDVTVSDHDHHQRKDSGQQSTESVHDEPEDHPMGEKEALLLADRLEAETDRMLAEQKELDLKRLHHSMIGAGSRASLASSSATRTPGKSPALERFGFFYRGRRSHATLSPASSTTASVDFSRAQSVEPLLTPRTYLESSMQLMTPPTSPMSPQHKHDNVSDDGCRCKKLVD